jgi:polysaccharide biosynthesis transport protein
MTSIYDEVMIALHGVWNRRWLALAVAWGVCALGWLGISFIPNKYESRARVFVQTQSVLQGKMGITPLEQQANLDSIRQTLTSATNLEKVVRGTELARTIKSDRDVGGRINMLRTKISIVAQQNNLFEITAAMSDSSLPDRVNARISTQIVGKLIDIFQEENISGDRNETQQGLAFLDQQIAEQGRKLQEAEQARVAVAQKYQGLLPGAGSISQRMDSARMELGQIESQLAGAQSALSAINGQLAGTPAMLTSPGTGGSNPALSAAMTELATARARGWTDNHPDVIAIKRQIAAARASGGMQGSAGISTPNPAYQSLKSMQAERGAAVSALLARRSQLQGDLNTMAARQTQEPGAASEQDNAERNYAANKAQYDKLMNDRNDVQMRGAVQSQAGSVTFRVIDPPGVPSAPASPNRPLLFIGVLIAGIFAGVGAAFALSQFNSGFATAARLEKAAGLPVIGSVSETLNVYQIEDRRKKGRIFAVGTGTLAASCLCLIIIEFVQRSMA